MAKIIIISWQMKCMYMHIHMIKGRKIKSIIIAKQRKRYCLRRLTHTQSLYTCITHRDGQIYSIYAMHICTCTRLVCCTKIFNCKA